MACEDRGRGPAPLKLVVFGGTGLTGKEVVKQALEKGYSVTSVVRSPEKAEIRHANLEVVKGDACDVESFASVLKGKDAVMSCLGVVASIFNPTTFYSESMHAIMEGMRSFADMFSSQIQVPDIRAIFYIPAGDHKPAN